MPEHPLRRPACFLTPGLALLLVLAREAPAQAPDPAGLLLAGARRAYNEGNYPFAAARFREFITKYGSHKEIIPARYGLALALVEGPERDYAKAAEQLQLVVAQKDFPDHPFAVYYLGLALRGQGVQARALAASKPAEAAVARQRFEDAAKRFDEAATAFAARAKRPKAPASDREWAARASCDHAEALLRLGKPKEARAAVEPFRKDKALRDSRYRGLALYYHGFACFQLNDLAGAGRSLGLLSPFSDPVFGTHARYLLARVHHLQPGGDEREEARGHYDGVLKGHEAARKAAAEALKAPARFKNDPEEKARLEALVKGPAPDHVARAAFFLGVLQYEDGRFADAAAHFKALAEKSPLAAEARLRQGFCEVQLKQYDAALKTLQPLADKQPLLADQALLWIAKAQAGKADPKKPESFKAALDTFKKAADAAGKLAAATPPDPRAKLRRGEALLELAEAQQLARQPKEAAATYAAVLSEKLLPERGDEVLQALATAWQLAGDLDESDKACARFFEAHPKSVLAPAVLFRHAENAALRAVAAEKLADAPTRAKEAAKHNDEAVQRYQALLSKYPEFAQANLARHALGLAYYRKGDLEKAKATWEGVPAADRGGELAVVSYHLADVLLRLAPARADDAVAAGKLEEMLKGAAELLEAYTAAVPDGPHTPDALLKLGHAQQRRAKLLAEPADAAKALAAARGAYDALLKKFPKHAAAPQAHLERAKCLAQAKDVGGAVRELQKFAQDPLKKAPVAPMGLLSLATLLRGQGKPADAAKVLAECRKEHEAALAKDAARSAWVALLRYHHAAALGEAGQLADAAELFDQVVKAAPDRPEGWEGALRAGQCRKEAAEKKLADGHKQLANPALKPEQRSDAEKLAAAGLKELRDAATYLAAQADVLKTKKTSEDLAPALARARARMMYDGAWALRRVAGEEVAAARKKLQLERWKKLRDEAAKRKAPGAPGAHVPLPEVPPADVPAQPAEAQVKAAYKALLDAYPDAPLGVDARFELAELLAERDGHDDAIQLLQDALDKEPAQDLAERVKVRLGACLLDRGARQLAEGRAKLAAPGLKPADKAGAQKLVDAGAKDIEGALEQLEAVTENPKSPSLAQAVYREGECYLLLGNPAEAVKRLAKFRDHGPFQNLAGLSDRALLRLGSALGELKQWDASRQAYEALVARFAASPWVAEARYGVGWAHQQQGKYDDAVRSYELVTNAVATRLGARAQLNVGLCRMAQKKYAEAGTAFLVVPFTYDYPELTALALVEAARAAAADGKKGAAVKLLKRVLRDHPGTREAAAAEKRLKELEEE